MRLIATEFHGDRVRTCTYVYSWRHKLAALLWQFMYSWCSVRVRFISRCSMPSGSWIPRGKAQERTDCLQWVRLLRKHAFMRISTHFGKSIPTMASQTFLFVPDSIKLGRACSCDVYSVLRTKAERFFNDGLCYSREPSIVILCTPLILPRGLCYNYAHAQTVCTRRSFSPPPRLGTRLMYRLNAMFRKKATQVLLPV